MPYKETLAPPDIRTDEGLVEVRPHGRDGQGVVTAGELLAQAALIEGKDFQSFPEFSAERSGVSALSPCPRGWRSDPAATVELGRIAVDACMWPLYEVHQGEWRLS